MSLDSLLETGLQLTDLSDDLRMELMKVFEQTAVNMDTRGIVNMFKALGKMKGTWTSFPSSTQEALWQSFEKNAPQILSNRLQAALTVHSFGQLGLDCSILSDKQRQLLFNVAMSGIDLQRDIVKHVSSLPRFPSASS